MILTLGCIATVFLLPIVVGAPVRWLLARCRPLTESDWVDVPFVGAAVIIVVLQNLVYLDVPVQEATPFLWAATAVVWVVWLGRGGVGASLKQTPVALGAVMLAVYGIHGLGLLQLGARYYLGRAWWDEFGYVAFAEFLLQEPFSTTGADIGTRPYLNTVFGAWKHDRHGQSVWHAFLAATGGADAKTFFEPLILLSPALVVLAIFGLARRLGLPSGRALVASAVAGLVPGLAQVHLESFLAQALAIPFLLCLPLVLDDLAAQPDWGRLARATLHVTALTQLYLPFWVLALGLVPLILGLAAWRGEHRWRLLVGTVVVLAGPLLLIPYSVYSFRDNIEYLDRVDPKLESFESYPWAYKVEGVSRLWLGDLATAPSSVWRTGADALLLTLTFMAGAGLVWACGRQLWACRTGWPDAGAVRRLACLLSCVALLCTPGAAYVTDPQRVYSVYKLVLSVSPLLALGLALWPGFPLSAGNSGEAVPTQDRAGWRQSAFVLVQLLVAGLCLAGTAHMALGSARTWPVRQAEVEDWGWNRQNSDLLTHPSMREVQDVLTDLHDQDLFIVAVRPTLDRPGPDQQALVNAWLSYFARRNRVRLGFPYLVLTDDTSGTWNLTRAADTAQIVDLRTLPDDTLILSAYDTGFVPTPFRNATIVWSNDRYVLWQPSSTSWAVPLALHGAAATGTFEGQPWLWLGSNPLALEVLASVTGTLLLRGTCWPNPDLPPNSEFHVQVRTGRGALQEFATMGDTMLVRVPVVRGRNTVWFELTNAPTLARALGGDPETALLGVQGLQVGQDGR